tara:strand:+ start:189 stop:440 length:252 start_codon:yes stop_codon:yes gene_type:complete
MKKIEKLPKHCAENDIDPSDILAAFNCIASLDCSYEHGLCDFLTKKQLNLFNRLYRLADEFSDIAIELDLSEKIRELKNKEQF